MHIRTSIVAAPLLAIMLCFSSFARADDLKDVSQLVSQGQYAQAMDRINDYLEAHPKDVQGQFLKGVILAEQNKSAEAIKAFTTITEQHPELPEPYNNLAVLYADQGQYDKARRALELAIRTHPSYATAHENLGDIYARMASDAYDKALQLDKGNARTQTRLAMVKDLFSGSGKPVQVAPKVTAIARPTPPPSAPTVVPTVARPAPKVVTVAAPAEPPAKKPATAPEKEKPAASDKKDKGQTAALTEAVKGWAKAWSGRDVDAYLAYYAANFKTPDGESRSAWEKSRRARIGNAKSISVELSGLKVAIKDDTHASVRFKQNYRAGSVSKRTTKTLLMKKSGDKWLIEQELTDR